MTLPIYSEGKFRWEQPLDEGHTLQIVADNVRQERTGLYAIVKIGVNRVPYASDDMKLAKQEERTRLAKSAFGHFKDGEGDRCDLSTLTHYVDLFCMGMPESWEASPAFQGDPPLLLSSTADVRPPEYLLKPLILKRQPTMLYADGDSCKSYMALFAAGIVSTAWAKNPMGFGVQPLPVHVLYLDWETDEEEIQWRLKVLMAGTGMPEPWILYRRCKRPMHEDAKAIANLIKSNGIGLIVSDSMAGACGGDLKDNEVANNYFGALRSFGIASLTNHHITKAGRDGDASAFGTIYFHNWTRVSWEMKATTDEDTDCTTVGMYHVKRNNTRHQPSMGFRIEFENEGDILRKVAFHRVDIRDDPILSKKLSQGTRIIKALERGELRPEALANAAGVPSDSIYMVLKRLAEKGKVIKRGDAWGLPSALPF